MVSNEALQIHGGSGFTEEWGAWNNSFGIAGSR